MIANGAVRAPLFGGMARAAEPLFRGGQLRIVEAGVSRSARVTLKDAQRAFERLGEEDAPEVDASEAQAT